MRESESVRDRDKDRDRETEAETDAGRKGGCGIDVMCVFGGFAGPLEARGREGWGDVVPASVGHPRVETLRDEVRHVVPAAAAAAGRRFDVSRAASKLKT